MLFGFTVGILSENKSYNFRLFFVNNDFFNWLSVIGCLLYLKAIPERHFSAAKHSVGNTCIDAVADTFGKTFTVFFGVPFQKHFVEFAAFVFGYRLERGYNFYAVFFFKHFFVHNAVATVSREPVEHINDYVLERSRLSVGNHFLKSGAMIVRSAFCFIRIGIDYFYAFVFGKFTANANLSLYTLLVLTLRTEPSVNYSVFHFTSEKIYFFGKQPIGKWRNGQGISRKYCRIRRLTYSFQRYFIPLTEPTFSDTIIPKNKIEKFQ